MLGEAGGTQMDGQKQAAKLELGSLRATLAGPDGKQYTAVLEPERAEGFEGYFNAEIAELPGCISYGESRQAAIANLREALQLYLAEADHQTRS